MSARENDLTQGAGTGEGGSCPPAFLTRGARGAVLPSAFYWNIIIIIIIGIFILSRESDKALYELA